MTRSDIQGRVRLAAEREGPETGSVVVGTCSPGRAWTGSPPTPTCRRSEGHLEEVAARGLAWLARHCPA
ncbi:hypothetical protein [Nonomuraea sp. NPDC049158]|uniref:hypothetical protein n=1 Tax=Nonomuraea sp. NPDC049158 TaxID=3155649 RepID=UPI0033E822E0